MEMVHFQEDEFSCLKFKERTTLACLKMIARCVEIKKEANRLQDLLFLRNLFHSVSGVMEGN